MKQIFLLLSILLLLLTVCACSKKGILDYCWDGDLEGVKPYVEKGEIERTDKNGFSPLLIATYHGHTRIVEYLVENGADVNRQDNRGWTSLRYAYSYNYKEIAEILLKHNAVVFPARENPIKSDNAVVSAFDQAEPWSGKWKVQGGRYAGIYAMKQNDDIVKSTKNSHYEFKGKVAGNQLKGRLNIGSGLIYPFVINISSDGMSFEGNMKTQQVNHFLKGKRME